MAGKAIKFERDYHLDPATVPLWITRTHNIHFYYFENWQGVETCWMFTFYKYSKYEQSSTLLPFTNLAQLNAMRDLLAGDSFMVGTGDLLMSSSRNEVLITLRIDKLDKSTCLLFSHQQVNDLISDIDRYLP